MQLEWFRQHHKKVFWLVAIVVIPSFILWIPTGKTTGESGGASGGPSGFFFHADGSKENVSWDQIFNKRLEYTRFLRQGEVSGKDALQLMGQNKVAAELGFDAGPEELKTFLRERIRQQTGKAVVSPEVVELFLHERSLTESQFQRLGYEMKIFQKYLETVRAQFRAPDNQLFLNYCMEKSTVRMLFAELETKDFEAKVDAPKAEEIKDYYEKNKDVTPPSRAALYTRPTLSVNAFGLTLKAVKESMKPTEEQLKGYYDLFKIVRYKIDEKKGPDPENLKKYEDVKDLVAQDYIRDNVIPAKNKKLEAFRKAFREAQVKAEAEKKPVDYAALAKDHGLLLWRTKPLTEEGYEKGSEALEAPDFKFAADLFETAAPDPKPDNEKIKAIMRKMLQAERTVGKDEQEAYVLLQIPEDGYRKAEPMSLEEATPEIARRLVQNAAIEKAKKAADELYAQWAKGENIPKPAELHDETFTIETRNRLGQAYLSDPKPIGEVLKPVFDYAKDEDQNDPRRFVFRVGFAVDRTMPSYETYEKDFSYSRNQARMMLINGEMQHLSRVGGEYPHMLSKPQDDGKQDQPLFREVRPES
ncbi:MAG: hypothetical protein KIS92_20925 [Planctomycetota bacterium]|nr:hypothetical protein [Planctomycetota bacterium]